MRTNHGFTPVASGTVVLSILFVGTAALAQPASFIARRDFATGKGPGSVVVADFNGDGKQDLATINQAERGPTLHGISVLLGNGDGTFQGHSTVFANGYMPRSLAAGDFNADGAPDLAVANNGSDNASFNVAILLGSGDGTFQAPVEYPVGRFPSFVAVGDFNRDGHADLVAANQESNDVSVLIGSGGGTFQGSVAYAVGIRPRSVAAADFNGDDAADLAVVSLGSHDVSILLANGDGTFQPASSFPTDDRPEWVTVADLNGDGARDLAVVSAGDGFTPTGHISVLAGNGDGTFQPGVRHATGVGAVSVGVGDVDADGRPDLLAAALSSAGAGSSALILLANADGTFQTPRAFATGSRPNSVGIGDFDGDGRVDVATANSDADTVSILLGNGDGSFFEAPKYGANRLADSVAAGDFNRDGVPDLAVANQSDSCSVLLGYGDGTFQAAQTFAAGDNPMGIASGDLNGDGELDVATANWLSNTVSVLLGNGDGTLRTAVQYAAGVRPMSIAAADFNGDGALDLAVANDGLQWGSVGRVSVLPGNGDGTFRAPVTLIAGRNSRSVAARDLDGDGDVDLAVANAHSHDVSVMLGSGDGTFQAAVNYATGSFPASVAIGDLDRDGVADLAVGSSPASVLLGNGDGTFQAARNFHVDVDSGFIAVAELTGDGIADLAFVGFSNVVWVLAGNGDGSFQTGSGFGGGHGTEELAAADFNGDGRTDIAVANRGSNDVSVLINRTVTAPAAAPTFNPAPGTYSHPLNVALATSTGGATIHYTTDGSTPTTASAVYTGPIPVTRSLTFRAIAAASGMENSTVAEGAYTLQAATPTFNPPGGTYLLPQLVSISSASPDVTIYYTTDGSMPTTASKRYTGSFLVGVGTTAVRAIAVAPGWSNSAVATAIYRIPL